MASIYLGEVAAQSRCGLGAAVQLDWALRETRNPSSAPDDAERRRFVHSEVFRALHSLLTHASNVSKLLWPAETRPGWQARAERPRDLRERLEGCRSPSGSFIVSLIQPAAVVDSRAALTGAAASEATTLTRSVVRSGSTTSWWPLPWYRPQTRRRRRLPCLGTPR